MNKILVLCCGLVSFCSQAELNVVENYKYYPVQPSSKEQLYDAVDLATPIKINGSVFHGYTQWNISWNFRWIDTGSRCKMKKVNTKLKLEYTLPKLSSTDKQIKAIWHKWYANFEQHEMKHGMYAKEAAEQVNKQLSSMRSRRDCATLSADANRLGNKILEQSRVDNDHYDKRTSHGRTENAWLADYLR